MHHRGFAQRSVASALAVLLLVALSLVDVARAEDVKIASFRSFVFFPVWMAKEGGFFEREGLNVALLFFGSGAEMTAALLSKSVAFATTMADRPMVLRDRGQKVWHLIALTGRSPFSLVVPAGSTAAPGDLNALKGKKIGITQRGSSTDVAVRAILHPSGIDPDRDVTLLALGSHENGIAAMKAGQIEALIVSEPATSVAVTREKVAKMFVDLRKGEGPPLASRGTFATLQATDDFVRANPEVTKRAIRAVCLATKAAKADLQAAVRVAQKYYPTVEPHLLESALSVELATHGSEITEEMIRVVSEVNVGAKVIQKSYGRDDVVVGPEFRALWQC